MIEEARGLAQVCEYEVLLLLCTSVSARLPACLEFLFGAALSCNRKTHSCRLSSDKMSSCLSITSLDHALFSAVRPRFTTPYFVSIHDLRR